MLLPQREAEVRQGSQHQVLEARRLRLPRVCRSQGRRTDRQTFYPLLDLAEWLERLTANAKYATVLGSIPASSDTVESEWRQMKQC